MCVCLRLVFPPFCCLKAEKTKPDPSTLALPVKDNKSFLTGSNSTALLLETALETVQTLLCGLLNILLRVKVHSWCGILIRTAARPSWWTRLPSVGEIEALHQWFQHAEMGAAQQETKKNLDIWSQRKKHQCNIDDIGIIRAKGNEGLDVRVVKLILKSHQLYINWKISKRVVLSQ